jgi:hypothetical protein
MKILVSSLFFASRVECGAYQDGYKEGEIRAQTIWEEDYDGNCDSIFAYSIEVKGDVVNGDYNPSQGQNWSDEAFNRGGRHGASSKVVKKQEDCFDPKYRDELGNTAAELVVADFCETPSLENVFSVLEMCRVSSTVTCKGFIVDKIEEAIKQTGSCGEINDDIDDLTIAGQLDLQDKCEE